MKMKYTRGSEIKIDDIKGYNVSYGTMNKIEPKTLFVKISAWGEPKIELDNYSKLINILNKRIRTHSHINIDNKEFNNSRTMINFSMKDSGMRFGKETYMNCEITLFQNNLYEFESPELSLAINGVVDSLLKDILDPNENFMFRKKKKPKQTKRKLNRKD